MKSDRSASVQYAALPFRRAAGSLEVMLVTSRETRRWVIPKGWPIDGLTPAECAAQEAFEEAGVRGPTSESLGRFSYDKWLKDGSVRRLAVEVYPLEVAEELAEWPEATQRERRWVEAPGAADLVDEPELAEIIRRFSVASVPPRT